jgi:hypothetical protein
VQGQKCGERRGERTGTERALSDREGHLCLLSVLFSLSLFFCYLIHLSERDRRESLVVGLSVPKPVWCGSAWVSETSLELAGAAFS